METRVFDASQRRQVRRAAARAESLTAGFYCIPGREWPRFPYDISTLAHGPGPDEPVFADVVRMVPAGEPAAPPRHAKRDHYRIRLRDDEILSAVDDRTDLRLFPLLLYVLTHELIHVVRFESGSALAPYDAPDPEARCVEESRVHAITRKVLQPAGTPWLRRVEQLYC
jgi:hypothetical protein